MIRFRNLLNKGIPRLMITPPCEQGKERQDERSSAHWGLESRSMWKTFDLACTPGITGSHRGQIERLLRGLDFIPEQ